jgi:hypothetical protein
MKTKKYPFLSFGAYVVIVIVIVTAYLTSCSPQLTETETEVQASIETISLDDDHSKIHVVTYDGHEYIVFTGYNKGGICHSASCPCHDKNSNQ